MGRRMIRGYGSLKKNDSSHHLEGIWNLSKMQLKDIKEAEIVYERIPFMEKYYQS